MQNVNETHCEVQTKRFINTGNAEIIPTDSKTFKTLQSILEIHQDVSCKRTYRVL